MPGVLGDGVVVAEEHTIPLATQLPMQDTFSGVHDPLGGFADSYSRRMTHG